MKPEIYYGDLKECIYVGYIGNMFGADHDKIVEEGVYFIKLKDNEYIRLEELLSNKKKKEILKDYATKKGQIFAGNLVLVNDLVESQSYIKDRKVVL